jgi:hypothetical protein
MDGPTAVLHLVVASLHFAARPDSTEAHRLRKPWAVPRPCPLFRHKRCHSLHPSTRTMRPCEAAECAGGLGPGPPGQILSSRYPGCRAFCSGCPLRGTGITRDFYGERNGEDAMTVIYTEREMGKRGTKPGGCRVCSYGSKRSLRLGGVTSLSWWAWP